MLNSDAKVVDQNYALFKIKFWTPIYQGPRYYHHYHYCSKKLSTLMFGNGLVTLPIQENFYGGAPTEMISAVMINYFSQSSVTETLKAEHMLTLSLFQANGQKMKVKLRSPVILGISIILIL